MAFYGRACCICAFSMCEILTVDEGGCGLGVHSKAVEAEVVVVVEDDA